MNIPGFTAEVSIYNSLTTYYPNDFIHTEIGLGLNVIPQLWCAGDLCWYQDDVFYDGGGNYENGGRDLGEIQCRRKCYGLHGNNRKACLDDC